MTTVTNAISRNIFGLFEKIFLADKASFTYWRTRMLYSAIIGYAAFYLVRQNLSMAMPGIGEEFGYDKSDLGWIGSIWSRQTNKWLF